MTDRETEHIDGVGQVFSISQAVREMSKAVFLLKKMVMIKFHQKEKALHSCLNIQYEWLIMTI
jgi:hypothetical protein